MTTSSAASDENLVKMTTFSFQWYTYTRIVQNPVTHKRLVHYDDVIMTTIASQITSLAIVYSTVYSGGDQRKHQSAASLAFVWGIHRDRWIPRTKGQLRGKCFHLMTSSCIRKTKTSIQRIGRPHRIPLDCNSTSFEWTLSFIRN